MHKSFFPFGEVSVQIGHDTMPVSVPRQLGTAHSWLRDTHRLPLPGVAEERRRQAQPPIHPPPLWRGPDRVSVCHQPSPLCAAKQHKSYSWTILDPTNLPCGFFNPQILFSISSSLAGDYFGTYSLVIFKSVIDCRLCTTDSLRCHPPPKRADADTEAPLQAVTAPPQRAPFPAVGVMFEKEEESRVKLLTPLKHL